MKIGILTFHCAHNYGAILQSYALQEYLKQLGHDVKIVDYRPSYLFDYNKVFSLKRILTKRLFLLFRLALNEVLSIPYRIIRKRNFDDYISRNLNITSIKSLTLFDFVFVGSDQVWNIKMTKGFDKLYWGKFNSTAILASYAASLGDDISILNKNKVALQQNLLNFEFVSVRERRMAELIQNYCSKSVNCCVDPTILNIKLWRSMPLQALDNNYVLVYLTKSDKCAIDLAKKIANEKKMKLINLCLSASWNNRDNFYQYASPKAFLQLFKYANYVVTTSFHGTVFSLLFERQFSLVRVSNSSNIRSESLLSDVQLCDRIYSSKLDYNKIDSTINWPLVSSIIDDHAKSSRSYIKEVLTHDISNNTII